MPHNHQSTSRTALVLPVGQDDLYWFKYKRKIYIRDHPNPSTSDGVWYAPEGVNGYVSSSNYNCDAGFPPSEVCRFN